MPEKKARHFFGKVSAARWAKLAHRDLACYAEARKVPTSVRLRALLECAYGGNGLEWKSTLKKD